MTIIQSIILGLVEGVSEFLPISSTAHLIITANWLKIPETATLKSFLIAIQLGAILSVAVLYTNKLIKEPKLILKIGAAFIPTALIGLAAYKLVKNYLMESLILISATLIIGGLALIILEKYFAKKLAQAENNKNAAPQKDLSLTDLSYKNAALIGVFQTLAIVPGVSRSAATIMGGLSLGISRKNIVEFSFLLALPTMAAATFLDLYQEPPVLNGNELIAWIIGLITAFLTAILGIKFFLRFIQKNDFQIFGWYRIVAGLIILAILFI